MATTQAMFTAGDLDDLPDDGKRYEINEGELVVTPALGIKHQGSALALGAFLYRAQRAGWGKAIIAPADVIFAEHWTTQPDLMFVRRERLDILGSKRLSGPPDLVVEILSPGTRKNDLGWKKRLYARTGVTFYWVVDPKARTVQSYVLREGAYVAEPVLRAGAPLSCPLFPAVVLDDVGELFA